MASVIQEDFAGGIFRGRRAPANTVYDAINGLVSDEREIFRRGGSEYQSGSNADDTILGLWDGVTSAGQRTVFWSDSTMYVLDSNDSSIVSLGSTVPAPLASGVEIAGLVFFQVGVVSREQTELFYAGSRKGANYVPGTNVAYTSASDQVTGTGTAFLANVDAGMILRDTAANGMHGIVKSVESNTVLTLTRPATVTNSSTTCQFRRVEVQAPGTPTAFAAIYKDPITAFHAVAGQRLIRVLDNRAYFTLPSSDAEFFRRAAPALDYVGIIDNYLTDYHELPRAALIIGADSIDDTLLLFTTGGVWAVANMALDAVDAFGNIQHQVAQISQDLILWGDPGIAAYKGGLIIPAIDDVYGFGLGSAPVPLSEGVRPLYREYVEAGYKPGIASVYRGHYWLPILDSSNNVIDSLTARLDMSDSRGNQRPAWTRQANGAAGRAYQTRVGSTARTPKLLGLDGLRVSDLTGCFDPDATRKDDADGTDHALTITTRDYQLGAGLQKGHAIRVRANYSLVDAASDNPTATMQWSRGPEGSSFTTVTAVRGGGESDGTEFSSWPINKSAEYIRFKWATVGAATSAVLRKIEVLVRPSGKQ